MTYDVVLGALSQLAAGFRLALVLFAAMLLIARVRGAWRLIGLSAVIYSPAHAAWLLGHPIPRVYSTTLDVICSATACAAFIEALAERGAALGLSDERVKRGRWMNVGVMVAVLVAAWCTR